MRTRDASTRITSDDGPKVRNENREKAESRADMVLRKSDLYASLWASCDQLRGGMDASQYKDYILTLLFVKYVSDKAKADSNGLIDVPDGGSFDDMLAAKNDKEIGDRLNKIIARLPDDND